MYIYKWKHIWINGNIKWDDELQCYLMFDVLSRRAFFPLQCRRHSLIEQCHHLLSRKAVAADTTWARSCLWWLTGAANAICSAATNTIIITRFAWQGHAAVAILSHFRQVLTTVVTVFEISKLGLFWEAWYNNFVFELVFWCQLHTVDWFKLTDTFAHDANTYHWWLLEWGWNPC